MSVHIINPSKRPAHVKHVEALKCFLKSNKVDEVSFFKASSIFFQTTHPRNIAYMILARALGKRVIFYYHEPCFFTEKLKKKNGLIYSSAVKLTQHFEYLLSTTVVVSNGFLKRKVLRIHNRIKDLITIPLIITNEKKEDLARDIDVLFLGRSIPDQRSFREFTELAVAMPEYKFGILTADDVSIPDAILNVGTASSFTDEKRIETLERSKVVWTPYNSNYNQSGVIPDALAHGCGVVVSQFERDRELRQEPFVLSLSTRQSNWETLLKKFLLGYESSLSKAALSVFEAKYAPEGYGKLLPYLK